MLEWFDRLPLKPNTRNTLFLRAFGFSKIPLLFYLSPTVVDLSDELCSIRLPLNRRSKNHLGSMYFAALCAGADLAGGLQAMQMIRASRLPISLIFKDFHAEFLKRAEGDVLFTCKQGREIRELVERTITSPERQTLKVRITATVGQEAVAWFDLSLSLKRKS